MIFDEYQQAALDDFEHGQGHTVIQARAGSGKTTVVLEGVTRFPAWGTTLLTTYNSTIDHLKSNAPDYINVRTLHSLGLQTIRRRYRNVLVHNNKGYEIALNVLKEARLRNPRGQSINAYDAAAKLKHLVSLAKNHLVRSVEEIERLGKVHCVGSADLPLSMLVPLTVECLVRSREKVPVIDFDDMIYLPAKLDLRPNQFDFVVIDECQDVNAAQLHLARMACRSRLIAVGDTRQAIYLFRGADSEAMPRLVRELQAKTLPLSVTYRCATEIVDYVKSKIRGISDLQARPNAPRGSVDHFSLEDLKGPFGARPGDFVLSRLNAPLMPLCLYYLRQGLPAVVLGRDVGKGLVTLIKKSSARTIPMLDDWLTRHLEEEHIRLAEEDNLEHFIFIQDRIDALRCIMNEHDTLEEVSSVIDRLFQSEQSGDVITLSSVHKAKGLEARRVWVLEDTFFMTPTVEEENLYYVACTRAQEHLSLVTTKRGVRPTM